MSRREKVFISYSHKDHDWLLRVREQLAVLEREGLIDVFDDTHIGAGEDWYARLHEEMLSAKLSARRQSRASLGERCRRSCHNGPSTQVVVTREEAVGALLSRAALPGREA